MTERMPLSSRENEVLNLLLEGKSNKLIASALNVSVSTVEFHLKNIYAKHNVRSRTELILKLGQSTVADKETIAENRTTLDGPEWFNALREKVSRFGKELNVENSMDGSAQNEVRELTFFDAIRICLRKYAEFHGRASRPEFWWFALFVTLAGSAFTYVHEVLGSVFMIAVLLPFLAVSTRRLRDIGKSGWWNLFLLVPVGGLVILGFLWADPPATLLPEDSPTV